MRLAPLPAALLLLSSTASAITLEKLETTGTFECIGVRVAYSGDDDRDASIAIRYRERGAEQWRAGHPLIRIAKKRFVTSLFWLKEGAAYEIELVPSDPEGAIVAFPQPFEVYTRSSTFPAPGRDVWVDASASAGGDGSRTAPFAAIQAAANAAQPGDTVRILPGAYREEVRPPRSGRQDAWIRFVADGPGVLLDGGETIPTGSGWTAAANGLWRLPYTRSPRYASLDGVRLYRHSSLANLANGGDGIQGGFRVENGFLYVKPPDGGPIENRVLRTGRLAYGFLVDNRAYIEIRGLEITHYDEMGVRFRNTHGSALRDCFVHDARNMAYVEGESSSHVLIEGNRIEGTAVPDWPWEICHHDHDCGSNGVYLSRAGEANVVRRNRIAGVYNGIYLGGWVNDYPDEWALENDVYENVIETIKDDAIEPECQAINLRIFRNVMRNLFVAVSLAPIETGPTWVLYNLVHHARPHDKGRGQWIKIAVTPRNTVPEGEVRAYHNTVFYDDSGHAAWSSVGSANTWFLNNVVRTTSYVFNHSAPGPYPPGNVWDYNNFFTTLRSSFVRWEGSALTRAQFQALGFERNGVSAEPKFRDPAAGDFTLLPGDAGIDRALPLPGINDGWSGEGPDMGAFEHRPR